MDRCRHEDSTLIVVPGLTGPYSASHRATYELLTTAAKERGYGTISTAVLPGQADALGTRIGRLSLPAAVLELRRMLGAVSTRHARLCGISFGCGVLLSTVHELAGAELNDRISLRLWAPIPLWQSWSAFCRGPKPVGLGRDTDFCDHQTFYAQLQPVEVALPDSRSETKVCMGTCDEYSSPAWILYLRSLCLSAPSRSSVEVQDPIADCRHSVTRENSPGYTEYLDFMLD